MKILLWVWLGVGLIFSLLAFGDDAPSGNQVMVRAIAASGTGCQAGTVSSALSPDSQTFSLLFDRYEATAGGTERTSVDKKTCSIDLMVEVPSGWSFTVVSADYRGYAAVDVGATGFHEVVYSFDRNLSGYSSAPHSTQYLNYYTPASRWTPRPPVSRVTLYSFSSREFRGPYEGEYAIHNELPIQTLSWSPCNGSDNQLLKIETALLVRKLSANSQARATLALDSVDGALQQSFGLKWKRCGFAPSPVPVPTPQPLPDQAGAVSVYDFSNGRDHLLTTNPYERVPMNYRKMGAIFRVFVEGRRGLVPLYRCVNDSAMSHFLSTASHCEGTRNEGVLGYISAYPLPGLSSLARYVSMANSSERVVALTHVAGDRGHFRFEGFLGYVPFP